MELILQSVLGVKEKNGVILSTIIKKIEHNYDAFLFSHLCILQK